MKIEYFINYESMSRRAAESIFTHIKQNPRTILCAASGESTLGAYKMLAEKFSRNSAVFENVRILKLDEWGGIPMDDPHSCETFLQEYLIQPFHIPPARYMAFQSNPIDKERECQRIATYLDQHGPVDLCILGLGLNGHIAFNEPGSKLLPHCHVAKLSERSLSHSMALRMPVKPVYGLSLGMADILQSRKIIILLSGKGKNAIAQQFLSNAISTQLPASFLWLHRNTTCLINEGDITIN